MKKKPPSQNCPFSSRNYWYGTLYFESKRPTSFPFSFLYMMRMHMVRSFGMQKIYCCLLCMHFTLSNRFESMIEKHAFLDLDSPKNSGSMVLVEP